MNLQVDSEKTDVFSDLSLFGVLRVHLLDLEQEYFDEDMQSHLAVSGSTMLQGTESVTTLSDWSGIKVAL
jgi:hypothetical protein